jgi:diaminohydroxyphosphoribosylaminopyrimidine deaminase/5-amino-6-(5-phosphoribosylamino)uracil reductase
VVDEHERFMRSALELGARATFTSPNPRVGAVLVRSGEVLAESFHEGAGRPHAEASVLRSADPTGATLYVNLEPCVHQGRTPPCAPAIVDAGVAAVVVAHEDPDPRARGRGLHHLRSHGVEVVSGVLREEAERLNAPYLVHRRAGRSFCTLKLALSLDGRLSAPDGSARWITGPAARARVHRRRAEVDAVMVGAGTVLADDPHLGARFEGAPRQPARVVVDGAGVVPPTAAVFDAERVIVATTHRASHEVQTGWKEAGAEVRLLSEGTGGVDARALLAGLAHDGIVEVLCEGGARLATSPLAADLVDRLELYLAPLLLGSGGAELGDLGVNTMSDAGRWVAPAVERVGEDVAITLVRPRGEGA